MPNTVATARFVARTYMNRVAFAPPTPATPSIPTALSTMPPIVPMTDANTAPVTATTVRRGFPPSARRRSRHTAPRNQRSATTPIAPM
jgi:hypothetical protein